jgi:hypothetical protein
MSPSSITNGTKTLGPPTEAWAEEAGSCSTSDPDAEEPPEEARRRAGRMLHGRPHREERARSTGYRHRVIWTSGGIDKLEVHRLGVREVWFYERGSQFFSSGRPTRRFLVPSSCRRGRLFCSAACSRAIARPRPCGLRLHARIAHLATAASQRNRHLNDREPALRRLNCAACLSRTQATTELDRLP